MPAPISSSKAPASSSATASAISSERGIRRGRTLPIDEGAKRCHHIAPAPRRVVLGQLCKQASCTSHAFLFVAEHAFI
eukprot:49610-Pyramimonas_sp.AAC.1